MCLQYTSTSGTFSITVYYIFVNTAERVYSDFLSKVFFIKNKPVFGEVAVLTSGFLCVILQCAKKSLFFCIQNMFWRLRNEYIP